MNIPPITDRLGKNWKQPATDEIEFVARMDGAAFEKLHDYSMSEPTALYAGKMWKSQTKGTAKWWLHWCVDHPTDPGKIIIHTVRIIIKQP